MKFLFSLIKVYAFSCITFLQVANSTTTPQLVGQWTFEPGNELNDIQGNFNDLTLHGAVVANGSLDVGEYAWANSIGYYGPALSEKTMIAWVRIDKLASSTNAPFSGGSALTIDIQNTDHFDGIVYAERQIGRWMAGSNYYQRTLDPVPGYQETTTNELVKIAICYKKYNSSNLTQVHIYRNDELIGSYVKGPLLTFAGSNVEIVFGLRHTLPNGALPGRPWLDAKIEEARIYSGCLSKEALESVTLDADNDGVADDQDNCPETANPNQTNSDNDEYGDVCDDDDDNDGILDTDEINCGSDPLNADSTCEVCDGIDNDLDGTTDEGYVDTDNDGIANCVDTDDDNDGLTDECDSNPLVNNFVFNGIENLPAEWICGNNPNNPKVYICHAPPGNPTNVQTICVSPNAVQAHLNHGCMLGQCFDCATGNGEAIPNSMSLDHTDRVNQIEFTVFPNPASGFLHIQIDNDFSSNISLEMFDQLGRKVWEKDIEGHYSEHQINLDEENIENGVYILNLHSNEFQETKRIIIAKQ